MHNELVFSFIDYFSDIHLLGFSYAKEIENNKFHWEEELEDIHMNIEFALEKKIGRAAQKLHTGRSRNDQVVTDLKLYLIESINEINSLITKTQKSLANKALKFHNQLKIIKEKLYQSFLFFQQLKLLYFLILLYVDHL